MGPVEVTVSTVYAFTLFSSGHIRNSYAINGNQVACSDNTIARNVIVAKLVCTSYMNAYRHVISHLAMH